MKAAAACEALLDHCAIVYDDINARAGDLYVMGWSPYRWAPVPAEGQRHLAAARTAVQHVEEALVAAVEVGAPERRTTVDSALASLRRIADQSSDLSGAGFQSVEAARAATKTAVREAQNVVSMLPTYHGPGGRFFIPDTNALVWQPDLTAWSLGEGTMVIVPTAVSELDILKQRRGAVADKAAKVIRVLGEMERRGDTFEGVPLRGRSRLRELAIEPTLPFGPPWLDADSPDDRIIRAAIAMSLHDLRAAVYLVTRDRNVRNKARLAGIAVEDPSNLVTGG
jgi:hypothetical protein